MTDEVKNKLVSAVAGVLIGWVGQSLALSSRVDAIEASQARIEARLDAVLGVKK